MERGVRGMGAERKGQGREEEGWRGERRGGLPKAKTQHFTLLQPLITLVG